MKVNGRRVIHQGKLSPKETQSVKPCTSLSNQLTYKQTLMVEPNESREPQALKERKEERITEQNLKRNKTAMTIDHAI